MQKPYLQIGCDKKEKPSVEIIKTLTIILTPSKIETGFLPGRNANAPDR
jgi:hypothetical protein